MTPKHLPLILHDEIHSEVRRLWDEYPPKVSLIKMATNEKLAEYFGKLQALREERAQLLKENKDDGHTTG